MPRPHEFHTQKWRSACLPLRGRWHAYRRAGGSVLPQEVGGRGLRGKPSPWGEGGCPQGLTDVGSIVFPGSPKIRTGSPPHPAPSGPPSPAGEGFSPSRQAKRRFLLLRHRTLAGGACPAPTVHRRQNSAKNDPPGEFPTGGSFLYPIFTSPSGQGLLRTRARWKCRRGGWWTDPHWCRQRP